MYIKKDDIAAVFAAKSWDRGFTLIEVLIAMFLMSFALLALSSFAVTSLKATEGGRRMMQAVNIATQKTEAIKSIPYNNLHNTDTAGISRTCGVLSSAPPTFNCTPAAPQETLDNIVYTWSYKVIYVDVDGDGTYLTGTFTPPYTIDGSDIKRVDLTVTWKDIMGPHTYTITTLRKKI